MRWEPRIVSWGVLSGAAGAAVAVGSVLSLGTHLGWVFALVAGAASGGRGCLASRQAIGRRRNDLPGRSGKRRAESRAWGEQPGRGRVSGVSRIGGLRRLDRSSA